MYDARRASADSYMYSREAHGYMYMDTYGYTYM